MITNEELKQNTYDLLDTFQKEGFSKLITTISQAFKLKDPLNGQTELNTLAYAKDDLAIHVTNALHHLTNIDALVNQFISAMMPIIDEFSQVVQLDRLTSTLLHTFQNLKPLLQSLIEVSKQFNTSHSNDLNHADDTLQQLYLDLDPMLANLLACLVELKKESTLSYEVTDVLLAILAVNETRYSTFMDEDEYIEIMCAMFDFNLNENQVNLANEELTDLSFYTNLIDLVCSLTNQAWVILMSNHLINQDITDIDIDAIIDFYDAMILNVLNYLSENNTQFLVYHSLCKKIFVIGMDKLKKYKLIEHLCAQQYAANQTNQVLKDRIKDLGFDVAKPVNQPTLAAIPEYANETERQLYNNRLVFVETLTTQTPATQGPMPYRAELNSALKDLTQLCHKVNQDYGQISHVENQDDMTVFGSPNNLFNSDSGSPERLSMTVEPPTPSP